MTHHAPQAGSTGASRMQDEGPRVRVRARELPPVVRAARDDLFTDADRLGPRAATLAMRVIPALVLLPLALVFASARPVRSWAIDAFSGSVADVVLVAPALVAFVLLAAALAPLARTRVEPLLGAGMMLLAFGGFLVDRGDLVVGAIPAAYGAALLGVAAARAVRRAVWALPLVLAAGLSDAHSVAAGVTGRLLADGGVTTAAAERVAPTVSVAPGIVERVDLLVLHVPAATGTWMLGLVDVVALGLLLGLAHLFWLPLGRTSIALGAALVAAVALDTTVPVLPLLGVAWVLVNARLVWRSTRFSLRRLTYLGG
ncbi:MAG: hypothetical protein JWL76_1651 [Thermoleophilia bacterium]|nr:hypothetical protein [Thermoleophilia bacterium]